MLDQPVSDADALRGILNEDTRINQRLGVALLDAVVHDVCLFCGRVVRVYQRKLLGVEALGQ